MGDRPGRPARVGAYARQVCERDARLPSQTPPTVGVVDDVHGKGGAVEQLLPQLAVGQVLVPDGGLAELVGPHLQGAASRTAG